MPAAPDTAGPLTGITVIDLSRVLSGPFCTMQLADMGARVIKVEQPGRGDDTRAWGPPFPGGESAYYLSINRNKESLALDLKHAAARGVLERLLARADVVVENFRPGTAERLGVGYAQVRERWPRVIYCSISGFGQTGPRRDAPGYDSVVQAEGGLMSVTGHADRPPVRLGVAIGDMAAGLYAAYAIALALMSRHRSGRGQFIDVGMLDSVASLLTYQAALFFADGTVPRRMGNRHPTIAPYDTLAASDGDFVLAVGNDEQWRRLCATLHLEHLASDPRYATNDQRVVNYDGLRPVLAEKFATRSRDAWIETLLGAGVPCGSVREIPEVLADPQLAARDMIVSLPHATAGRINVLGVPPKLSETPGRVLSPPPRLGEHTDAILKELGFEVPEIDAMRSAGAI
ncbi:MAG TPA: CaiB/BaiF CoA-transferase family protein [Vicinamibacterales bacterium]|nr:CaiB/BaiF CoA-transferase family protein [Vicinamibacterales bacterium]